MLSRRFIRMTSFAVATGGMAVALGLGPAAGPAGATTWSAPSPASTALALSGSAGQRGGWLPTLLRRAEHAEVILRTKTGFRTIYLDRGTVSSISPSSISLMRPDGVVVGAAIDSSTKFRGLPQSEVAVGDKALVIQSSGTAISVRSRTATSSSSTTST
jgi:hypothetical protein